jgi:hypothetical protein
MRAAAAVQVTLAPDRGWRLFARLLGAATSAGLAGALLLGLAPAWAAAGAALAALLGACGGAALLAPPHAGTLRWDGAAWSWQPSGQGTPLAGQVALMIDLGPWVLLRWRSPGQRARWLPLAQAGAGPMWQPLRVALAAHGRGRAE